MKTIAQYFPAMSETKGRSFSAPSLPELCISAATVALALSGGVGVPLYQQHAQQVKLDEANAPIVAAMTATQASIAHIEALTASADAGTAKLARAYVDAIQARLKPIHAVSVAQVKADLVQQQQAYAQAQDLIAHSPYKDRIGLSLFGVSAEQKAYDQARQVQKPDTVTDFVGYAMDQAQVMTGAAESARSFAASDEQAIVTMVGGQAPKAQPVAVAPASTPVAAPVPPAPAPVAAPAITANNGNNHASGDDANIGLFGARSPAAPKVAQKVTISAPVHREPIITKSTPIVRTPTVAPAPRRPAESEGFIEQ